MTAPAHSRAFIAVSGLFLGLLLLLSVLQYRASGSVAQSDVARSQQHLREAAAQFANDFDLRISQLFTAIQDEHSPDPVARQPSDLVRSVTVIGDSPLTNLDGCNNMVYPNPPALRIPVAFSYSGEPLTDRVREVRRNQWTYRCWYAPLDTAYLWKGMLPALLRKYFGEDAWSTFAFTVWQRERNNRGEAGNRSRPLYESDTAVPKDGESDAEQAFFRLRIPETRMQTQTQWRQINRGLIDRQIAERSAPGIWLLEVRNRSGSLAAQLAHSKRVNFLTTVGLDLMLLLTAFLLVAGVRRMDAAARQKMQFVAGVSHELRNPLAALSVLSRNLSDGLVRDSAQVRQYGELMNKQAERLTQMVEHTLQYAGIHSRSEKAIRSHVDIRHSIEAALEAWRAEIDARKFEVEQHIASGLPGIAGDPLSLEQAIGNLIGNAIKYSNGTRWIGIRAVFADEGRSIAISVEDRGIGMDPGERARVGEPFFRGKQVMEAQIPGAGLGLSLVRMAAEAHGGKLLVESEAGAGSKFTIRLPVGEAG